MYGSQVYGLIGHSNVIGDSFRGATWFLSHGGGRRMGASIYMVVLDIVLDGSAR